MSSLVYVYTAWRRNWKRRIRKENNHRFGLTKSAYSTDAKWIAIFGLVTWFPIETKIRLSSRPGHIMNMDSCSLTLHINDLQASRLWLLTNRPSRHQTRSLKLYSLDSKMHPSSSVLVMQSVRVYERVPHRYKATFYLHSGHALSQCGGGYRLLPLQYFLNSSVPQWYHVWLVFLGTRFEYRLE
jgi:hypothetical protein